MIALFCLQELRTSAIAKPLELNELENGIKKSIIAVKVIILLKVFLLLIRFFLLIYLQLSGKTSFFFTTTRISILFLLRNMTVGFARYYNHKCRE